MHIHGTAKFAYVDVFFFLFTPLTVGAAENKKWPRMGFIFSIQDST